MSSFPECNICKDAFRWKSPDPFLLPCLHAVCETCLNSAGKGNLHCPTCKRDFNLQTTIIRKDQVRQTLVLNLTAKHRPSELLCTHEDDGNQAVCWCQECEEFLCEHCHNLHGSFKALSSHTVQTISDIGMSGEEKESFCSAHKKYVLELFDMTCGIPICLKCRQENHSWHITEGVPKAYKRLKNILQDQLKIMTDMEERTQLKMQENDQYALQLDNTASLQRQNISNTFDTLKTLLDQRQKEITMRFENQVEKMKSLVSDNASALQMHLSTCSNIRDYAEIVIAKASRTELLSITNKIKDTVNERLTSGLHDKKQQQPYVTFVADGFQSLKLAISIFSELDGNAESWTSNPDPSGRSASNHPSEMEFLFKEEATEEQKARARKYLLPENFYLYENKPPCPGCIGCEDYDPSKSFTSRKQKTKVKYETPSPDSTPSVETSAVSGEFSLFRQFTGPPCSTLAAMGDGSDVAFKKDESRPFHWSWAGRPISGSSSAGGQKTDGDDEAAPSYDIYFKPIIDLPDLVEVKTGEEDWEVVYCQRSKLYRFVREVNQWKERAVGEMKILKKNEENAYKSPKEDVCSIDLKPLQEKDTIIPALEWFGKIILSRISSHSKSFQSWNDGVFLLCYTQDIDKYRLLMRRDQVHKVACNHLIDPSIKLEPMATSGTAWCWMAQDYAENEVKIEQFALRFKTEELSKQFKQKFEECQEHLRQIESDENPSKKSRTPTRLSVAQQLEEADEEADEEEKEDEDEDDSDEEHIVIFEKRATLSCFESNEWKKLGMGNLKIMYNDDLNGNNIEMQTDDGTRICNHVICREHTIVLERKHRVCMWNPIDFSTDEPVRRNFKAAFNSVAAAEEFTKTFNETRKYDTADESHEQYFSSRSL